MRQDDKTIFPAFVQYSKTKVSKKFKFEREFEDHFEIGLYKKDIGWIDGQIQVRWYGKKFHPYFEIINEDYFRKQKYLHKEVLRILRIKSLTPKVFIKRILKLNYKDISHLY